MEQLSGVENILLGSTASFFQAVALQPTIYWKNAAQQGLPFSINPRVVYRGMAAGLANEMAQMGFQYATTGWCKKLIVGGKNRSCSPSEEIMAALLGGAMVAPVASALECTMIQQQKFGGTAYGTPLRLIKESGPLSILRGCTSVVIRDAIYVGGLLGITPVLQKHFIKKYDMGLGESGMYASLIGGVMAGIVTCPFDCISTCMKGDMNREIYGGFTNTFGLRWQGGMNVFFGGLFWRTVNITGTIYLANEARVRLGPLFFPGRVKFD